MQHQPLPIDYNPIECAIHNPAIPTKRTIHYIDGPVGAGKTQALFGYLRSTSTFAILATQTNELSEEYRAAENLDITMFKRETSGEDEIAASKQLRARLISNPNGHFVINQSVAIACQKEAPNHEYFFDEIPSIFERFTFNCLPMSQEFLSAWLATETSDATAYYELVKTPAMENIAVNGWKDAILKGSNQLQTLASRIISPDYDVFVHGKKFRAFQIGTPGQITFFTIAKPSLYPAKTTIIGANFEHSLMNRIWSLRDDTNLLPHPNIKPARTDLSHKADQVEIRYVSERGFSKTLIETKKDTVSPTTFKKIATATGKAISEHYPCKKFLFCSNKEHEGKKWAGPLGTRISSNSKGWNGGRDYDMAVHLAAVNFDPASIRFLYKMFGISKKDAKIALGIENAYQFAGRSSLRDSNSTRPITLIFGDRATALAIAEYIPGCAEPKLLDIGIPELLFQEVEDDAETTGETANEVPKAAPKSAADRMKLKRSRDLISKNHKLTPRYEGFKLRVWQGYEDKNPLNYDIENWATLVALFEDAVQRRTISNKFENQIYREGLFFDKDNHLIAGNLRSSKLVILDFDDAIGDPLELSDWLKKQKISNLVVNTFSYHNAPKLADRKNCFRVLIPLTEAVDATNYKRIVRLLEQDIQTYFDRVPNVRTFAMDIGSRSINKWFLYPSRPERGEPFFIDGTVFKFDMTNFHSKKAIFLDAEKMIRRNLPEDYYVEPIKRHTKSGVKKAADEIVAEIAAETKRGEGDKGFYKAAVELVKAGYSVEDAVAALADKESMFGTGKGRGAKRAVEHAKKNQFAHLSRT